MAVCCTGSGVRPHTRCRQERCIRRGFVRSFGRGANGRIRFVTTPCQPRRCFRTMENLRGRPRNNGEYHTYFSCQLSAITGGTIRLKFSCFNDALAVDPRGGSRMVGSIKVRIRRFCSIRCLPDSFGGKGNCLHSVRVYGRCSICHRYCYKYVFTTGRRNISLSRVEHRTLTFVRKGSKRGRFPRVHFSVSNVRI